MATLCLRRLSSVSADVYTSARFGSKTRNRKSSPSLPANSRLVETTGWWKKRRDVARDAVMLGIVVRKHLRTYSVNTQRSLSSVSLPPIAKEYSRDKSGFSKTSPAQITPLPSPESQSIGSSKRSNDFRSKNEDGEIYSLWKRYLHDDIRGDVES